MVQRTIQTLMRHFKGIKQQQLQDGCWSVSIKLGLISKACKTNMIRYLHSQIRESDTSTKNEELTPHLPEISSHDDRQLL